MQGRIMDAALELLDHQLVDRDGKLAGNVDDVEVTLPEGWPAAAPGELPVVTALLSGPGVLAERFGGTVGRGWSAMHRRLHPGTGGSGAIPMAQVRDIGSAIHLAVCRDELESNRYEDWFCRKVIGKIPGANRAPE